MLWCITQKYMSYRWTGIMHSMNSYYLLLELHDCGNKKTICTNWKYQSQSKVGKTWSSAEWNLGGKVVCLTSQFEKNLFHRSSQCYGDIFYRRVALINLSKKSRIAFLCRAFFPSFLQVKSSQDTPTFSR